MLRHWHRPDGSGRGGGRWLGLLVASLAMAGCVSRPLRLDEVPQKTRLDADRIDLPANFAGGLPCVDLKINGKGPYRFLVDTGATGTSLSPQAARESGVKLSRAYVANVTGSSGESERQSMGIVHRLESPGLVLRGIAVTVLTAESVGLLPGGGGAPVGGILGVSALRDVRTEIDYPGRKVTVLRLETEPPPARSGIACLENRPYVMMTTPAPGHATATVLIDTGASEGFGLADIASYPLRVGLARADEYAFGIGGRRRPLFGQLAGNIGLGTITWENPTIHSSPRNRVGSKALATLKLVLDQRRRMLWLLEPDQVITTRWTGPLDPGGRPAVYGFALLPDGDAFLVGEVDPGSRAERAGLKVGDRVLPKKDDDRAVDPKGGDPYLARLNVVRGDQKLKITLSLAEPLPAAVGTPP